MTSRDLCDLLEKEVSLYRGKAAASIKRNRHMNKMGSEEQVSQPVIDALLVDFVNFVAAGQGMDLGLKTSDL